MTYDRKRPVSDSNPRPIYEASGTYNTTRPVSHTNPMPVMEGSGGSYSDLSAVSSANPRPVATVDGTYTRNQPVSDTNPYPIKIITGQSYSRLLPISETNPLPIRITNGSAYEGPLDLVPGAVVAWGNRAMSAALSGSAVYTIRRASDDTTLAVNASPDVDNAAVEAFIGASTGYNTVWQDQSGNNSDLTRGDDATQPKWSVLDNDRPGIGGQPEDSAAVGQNANSFSWSEGAAFALLGVFHTHADDNVSAHDFQAYDDATSAYIICDISRDGFLFEISDPEGTTTDWEVTFQSPLTGTFLAVVTVSAAGALVLEINGLDQEAAITVGSAQPIPDISGTVVSVATGRPRKDDTVCNSYAQEIFITADASAQQISGAAANMATYYGITLP